MLKPGNHVGPFKVLSSLGAGGMGEVYRARDPRLERDIALKVLPAETVADETSRARMVREARMAAKLNHPHVCTVHEVGESDGLLYIAMELVEGKSLATLLAHGPLPPEQVLRYGAQIAGALAHAHERGVVHRDLKSANVVITPDGQAKVLDFGLAKPLSGEELAEATTLAGETLTGVGMVAGTLAYMAPEQLRGRSADARSDVWALGIVLHEMASGERPFQGSTTFELSSAILSQPPPPLPNTAPAGLAAVVERCLAKEAGERFQRASEVEAALETIQSGGVVPGLARRPASKQSRRVWMVIAAVAAVVTVLAFLDVGGVRTRLLGGSPPSRIDSLAVLPLENLSGDPEQEYLAAGMHDALVTNLGQLGGLKRVVARGSVLRFKGTSAPPRQIARELGVAGLITGAVLRAGDRVRVTAQLIDPASEAQLWAHSYEAPVRDVLSLENEIVAAITREVKLELTPQEKARLATARPVNPEAYEAYMKGMFHLYKKTPEGFAKGLELLQQAIDSNPTDPLPYAGLAMAYPIIYHGPGGTIPPNQGFPKARAAALKALELDDGLAQAHLALAAIKTYHDWDWGGAEHQFKRAIELNPNLPEAHAHYGWYLHLFGRMEEGLAEARWAVELDPLTPVYTAWVGWMHLNLGDNDQAIEWADKALELDPNNTDALYVLTEAFYYKEMFQQAIETARKLAAVNPDWKFGLAEANAAAGRREEALALVAEMESEDYQKYAEFLVGIEVLLGNKEKAIRAIEAAFDYHDIFLPWNFRDDSWFPWRSDPRWQALRSRLNFPVS